jgi:Putative prokaryotic signal transducing protein
MNNNDFSWASLIDFHKAVKGQHEKWVVIFTTYDPLEAEIIKDLLESGGIPVVVRSSKVSPYPVNIGKMGEVKILVREADKAEAEKVIKEGQNLPTE